MYLNHFEVADARQRYATHPVLGPATVTLAGLVDAVDRSSDGWAYWQAPKRAARQLLELIGDTRAYLDNADRPDATAERLRRAYASLKAFRTRTGLDFELAMTRDDYVRQLSRTGAAELRLRLHAEHKRAGAHVVYGGPDSMSKDELISELMRLHDGRDR